MEHKPPKRPRSGYNFYQLSFLADGSSARHTQHAAKEVSKSWRRLSASEKAPYMAMANFDQNRYTHELIQFEEAMAKKREERLAETGGTNSPAFINLLNQRTSGHFPIGFPAMPSPRTHPKHPPQPSHPSKATRSMPRAMADPSGVLYAPGASGEAAGAAAAAASNRTPGRAKRESVKRRPPNPPKRQRGAVVQSSEGEVPNMLQSARRLLLASISYRHAELQEVQISGRRDLEKIDKLIREIVLCKQQVSRQEDDSYEAVVLSTTGSTKMQQAGIPAMFISFIALSLAPVRDTSLVGGVFLVEVSWRVGTVRCITRALCAFGSEYRAEMILSTLRPMSGTPGMSLRVKFLKFIRRSALKDSVRGLKDQIMLDLWSMGLIQHESKRGGGSAHQSQHSNRSNGSGEGRKYGNDHSHHPLATENAMRKSNSSPDRRQSKSTKRPVNTAAARVLKGSESLPVASDDNRNRSSITTIQAPPSTPPVYPPSYPSTRASSDSSSSAFPQRAAESRVSELGSSSSFPPAINWPADAAAAAAAAAASARSSAKAASATEGSATRPSATAKRGVVRDAGLGSLRRSESQSGRGFGQPFTPLHGDDDVFDILGLEREGTAAAAAAAATAALTHPRAVRREEGGRRERESDDIKIGRNSGINATEHHANETPTCRQCGVSLMGLPEIVYNDDPTAQDKTFCSRRCRDTQRQKLIEEFVNGLI
uniref:HMG box domain-containing protein n=2 Tax=Lotharella globosa TaxID=91324 RepID=A0A7S3Z3Y1_9EUKA